MASVAQPPQKLGDLVQHLVEQHRTDIHVDSDTQHPQTPPIPNASHFTRSSGDSHHGWRLPAEQRTPPPNTPSGRTGPPRSITGNYSFAASNIVGSESRDDSAQRRGKSLLSLAQIRSGEASDFTTATTSFRGALEYADPVQRERERELAEKKARRRDSVFQDSLNFRRWISDSPKEDSPPISLENASTHANDEDIAQQTPQQDSGTSRIQVSRTLSTHIQDEARRSAAPKWGRLRSLLPHITGHYKGAEKAPSTVVPYSVNITDELITGGLSTLMLRLWFERDEKDHRRVPIMFHRLRIRVSDSLHPLHGHKAVFRIECEYANGAVRWVVYRQLREFLSLHTHYALSNAYNRNVETLPEFPLTSLPYFKFLKEGGRDVGRADFARLQREALENYLIGLIRAVMFHPASNRLAGFLEISALSISLAQSGGAQYKAGLLRIDAVGSKGGFGRKGTPWRERKAQKWCSLAVWDVFLIDSEFKIERPTRYYRQGLNLFHQFEDDHEEEVQDDGRNKQVVQNDARSGHLSLGVSSLRSRISRVFHVGHRGHRRSDSHQTTSAHAAKESAGHQMGSASSRSSNLSAAYPSDRPLTPMLDPSTNTNPLLAPDDEAEHGYDATGDQKDQKKQSQKDVSKHTFYIENSQMKLKLFARNERQMLQWMAGLEKVARESHYTGKNRFDSFAPIRLNVAAQWLVDGRDYFWNLSRAILLAKESIYIHDWWLSPELQLRRPNKPRYRLDHLLERKAKAGVKIYIILYQEVSNRTTPTDSKRVFFLFRLKIIADGTNPTATPNKDLQLYIRTSSCSAHHPIYRQEHSTGHIWDTPQHVLVDDPDPVSGGSEHIWTGKDYSNPRIQDFHSLNKPDEDMYDRTKVPRMPWHDVSMQLVGQPARDLCRHFVQRWNHLLRIKNHSRIMPFLLPPPEFRPGELQQLGLTGTCELQICRSAGPWSLGTPDRIEHSIQNAYLKAIQMSEHFVYIENQFFITSTVVNEVKIENRIGDALVHRIIRAHRECTPWKCCILIPLLPGFSFPVDHSDASAIRIIMECQNRTICRGPNSIFGRLRKEGIDPDEYIAVFSLRNWAKMRGDVLTTEEVYIHGKVCIVDDRLAIIGSANINERSQRGDRDSEIAAVVRDTDMIDCTMAGKPFKVGRFAHTLRVRLMREHIGVDVDAMYEDDLMACEPVKPPYEQQEWDPDVEQEYGKESGVTHLGKGERRTAVRNLLHDTIDELEQTIHGTGDTEPKDIAATLQKTSVNSKGLDNTAGERSLREEPQMFSRDGGRVLGFPSAIVPTVEEKIEVGSSQSQFQNGDGHQLTDRGHQDYPPEARLQNGELYGAPAAPDTQRDTEQQQAQEVKGDADEEEQKALGARATLRRHQAARLGSKPWSLPTSAPRVDPHGFEDPICDTFWKNVWLACAVHNTEIYRKVFHAVPDDLVTTWKLYKEFVIHHERLNKPVKEHHTAEPLARLPSETADEEMLGQPHTVENTVHAEDAVSNRVRKEGCDQTDHHLSSSPHPPTPPPPVGAAEKEARERKTTKGTEPFDQTDQEEMEQLLGELRGHLVLYPTRFLEGEDAANNFIFNADRLLPLPIYD
ncbi:Phospholipase D1 [Sparassis crispa]|uniref:Phospholipase n=1 Tax=Sparassis crispa TaxID=139825 RepID=A0A401GLX5_9APHY|nr:Phospholipase D1 [Sparassis crispa]GBE83213.1 Phospholipase D1 [Sparassis crispa]